MSFQILPFIFLYPTVVHAWSFCCVALFLWR